MATVLVDPRRLPDVELDLMVQDMPVWPVRTAPICADGPRTDVSDVTRFEYELYPVGPEVFGLAVENCNRYAREVTIGFFGEQMLQMPGEFEVGHNDADSSPQ